MKHNNLILLCLLAIFKVGDANAQQVQPCDSPEYSQFDFWLGKWEVTTPDGKRVGTNVIRKTLNKCVVTEHYSTPTGFEGQSLNSFDRVTGLWHQTWVDNTGLVLKLDGQLKNGVMVLSGHGTNKQGGKVIHRITWSKNDDGTVRQLWQSKAQTSASWGTLFDGKYTPVDTLEEL